MANITNLSQFFILSPRGDTIIKREYRHEAPKNTPEIFFRKIKFWEGDPPPCFNVDGVNFLFIKQNGLCIVCTTMFNVSPSELLELLVRIANVVKDYCGVFNEEAIRKNFILVYELLDEMLDYGYPQCTTTEGLKNYIHNEPIAVAKVHGSSGKVPGLSKTKAKHSSAVHKPISVSRKRDKNHRNEIFVDILERLTVTFNNTGYVVASEIDGCIQMKSYLSGNPQLRLALNEDLQIGKNGSNFGSVVLDDANFHPCADLSDFENSRMLLISPPEGEFVVMNYRVSGEFHAPFRVFPFVEETSQHQLEMVVKVRADIDLKNHGSNVKVLFNVPKSAGTVSLHIDKSKDGQSNNQVAEYKESGKEVEWTIKKFQGQTEHTLVARITLTAPSNAMTRKELGPIRLSFEVPMYNASHLQVRYLRIDADSRYKSFKWVRYVTQANSYVCRV